MNLDTLAKEATQSLYTSVVGQLDTDARLDELRHTHPRRRAVKVVAAVAVAAVIGWFALGSTADRQPQPTTQYHNSQFSPARNGVVLVSDSDGVAATVSTPGHAAASVDLSAVGRTADHPMQLTWSPDGQSLAYQAPHAIRILDLHSQRSRQLLACDQCQIAWSPTGDTIAVVDTPTLRLVSAETGATLTTIHTPGLSAPSWPTWSPDGSQLAFTAHDDSRGVVSLTGLGLYRVNADGSGLTNLWSPPPGADARAWMAAWSPNGTSIAFVEQSPLAWAFWKQYGPVPRDLSIMTVRPNGTDLNTVAKIGFCWCPSPSLAWSPDGTRLAYLAHLGTSNALYEIWADGTGLHRLRTDVRGSIAWQPVR